jgi:colanic acid biosynthesis glycosyl transferase WcaI
VVVQAARQLADEPNLLFLLIGDGIARAGIEREAAGLKNVRFLPMQPKEKYPQVLAAADACLVTLKPEVLTHSVPSKISTIMAAGRPILASLPLHSDAPRIIAAAQAGIVTPAADYMQLAEAVRELKRNSALAAQLGANGRRFAEKYFARQNIVKQYIGIFQELIDRHKPGRGSKNTFSEKGKEMHP